MLPILGRILVLSLPGVLSPLPVISLYADDTSAIVTSNEGIQAVFDTYRRYEKASGSKLNLGKCKGLWLGPWRNRPDSPVVIDWSCQTIKVLGVYIGFGDLDTANWRPRIDSVSKCFHVWRCRSLSLSGKALVANALALSRIWYVASLVHMPSWVAKELNSHLFAFFWSGKKAKVSRKVVVQPKDCGGFSVVSIEHKAQALLAQWVKRYVVSPSSWVSLLTYWCFDRYGIDPLDVLAGPSEFSPRRLPPFYASLLYAWRAVGGSLYPSGTLSISGLSGARVPVSSVSCKYTYARLLELSRVDPHCVEKFRPAFGDLYWPFTWKQLFFRLLDRPVAGLSWKVAHGALFTMDRLVSFVVISPLLAFPVSILSRPNICSSTALLLRVVSIGFSLCCFYLLHLPPLFCSAMFFLDLTLTSCGSSRVFLFICCMCLNFLSGTRETIFVFDL